MVLYNTPVNTLPKPPTTVATIDKENTKSEGEKFYLQ
jgi:hypothetical protein